MPVSNPSRWNRIIQYLGDGLSDKDIALREQISMRCVKWYVMVIKRSNDLYGTADIRKLISLAARGKLNLPTQVARREIRGVHI